MSLQYIWFKTYQIKYDNDKIINCILKISQSKDTISPHCFFWVFRFLLGFCLYLCFFSFFGVFVFKFLRFFCFFCWFFWVFFRFFYIFSFFVLKGFLVFFGVFWVFFGYFFLNFFKFWEQQQQQLVTFIPIILMNERLKNNDIWLKRDRMPEWYRMEMNGCCSFFMFWYIFFVF